MTSAPAQPQNQEARNTIEQLEERLLDLELKERARSIDLRGGVFDWDVILSPVRFKNLQRLAELLLFSYSQ